MVAKVITIFKNGEEHLFNNYSSISLLSPFSKILEKWFASKLQCFLEKFNLISDKQYGFRAQRSTALALLELNERIPTAMENKHSRGILGFTKSIRYNKSQFAIKQIIDVWDQRFVIQLDQELFKQQKTICTNKWPKF